MFFLKQIFRAREHLQRSPRQDEKEMTFLEHLEELRHTIIRMLLTLAVAMALCFFLAPHIMQLLRHPAEQVWLRHEGERLPAHIDPQEWLQAKQWADLKAATPQQAAQSLEAHLSPRVVALSGIIPLLRAARLLPQKNQATWLEAATPAAQRDLALQLWQSGAELRAVSSRDTMKLMGAFRPGEAFMLSLQLSFYAGLIVSFPVLVLLVLHFIIPGLREHERSLLYKCVVWGFLLFIAGCAFAYWGVLPRVLSFFYEYSEGMGIENDWRIGYYLNFSVKLLFVFGVIFELPVIVVPLIKTRILRYQRMKHTRGYALIACFAAALVLAPAPDPATMILMALPMYALYELCILFAWAEHRKPHSDES